MKSEFGFHQPYKQNGDEMKCQKVDSQASSALLQYAEAMLEPEPAKVFHKLVFETPCREMKFFTGRELIDLGIATGVNKFSLFE